MRFQLNFKSGKPVYLQVVDQVKSAAASGVVRPGEPLPSIRPLAEELRVNRNTVAKAYAELESQGVIETIGARAASSATAPRRSEVRPSRAATHGIDDAVRRRTTSWWAGRVSPAREDRFDAFETSGHEPKR